MLSTLSRYLFRTILLDGFMLKLGLVELRSSYVTTHHVNMRRVGHLMPTIRIPINASTT